MHREGGFRFAIYTDDHEPAHVHVLKDGEVIINLMGAAGRPEIRQVSGVTRADQRKLLRIVAEQQEYLLAKWQEIQNGTD